ncbi:extensin family protein [Sagittula sp. NFXS13]|uniref:extensin-like domain-containing protein n=1 Tax=Sagittula sp. NFXS13 TaxID=2819095 RepID=UPI0032DE3F07
MDVMRYVMLAVLVILTGCGSARDRASDSIDALRARFDGMGSVCGDPSLIGETIGVVDGRGECGMRNGIRLRAVDGVALSQPAAIRCETARQLKTWINTAARPAVGNEGGGVAELKVAASYACRTRNHKVGAKLSEHSKGNAIDIAAVRLVDGTEMSVLRDWRSRTYGPMLKQMHKGACGTFGTTLGPGSDGFHEDHFHYDVADYRGGPYCK